MASKSKQSDAATESQKLITKKDNNGNENLLDGRTNFSKMLQTASLCLAFGTVGLLIGLIGAAFLDLIAITHSDVQKGSFIFVLAGLGSMAGSCVSGPLCDRVPVEILLSLSLFITGTLTSSLPWFTSFPLMLAVNFLAWTSVGITETAVNFLVIDIWKREDAPYTQAVYLSLAAGGIIGPLITEPFISENSPSDLTHDTPGGIVFNKTIDDTSVTQTHDSVIYIPFLICGAIHLVAAIPWVIIYCVRCIRGKKTTTSDEEQTSVATDDITKSKLSNRIAFLICTALFYCLFESIEDGFQHYTLTIVVEKLNWTKSDGARLTALFWGACTAANVVGIALVRVISPFALLCGCLVAMNISILLWIFLYELHSLVTWVSVALIGLFISPIFPISVTVTNTYMSSGMVAAMIIGFADVGDSLYPIVIGYLLKAAYPMASILAFLVAGVLSLALVIIIRITVFSNVPQQ